MVRRILAGEDTGSRGAAHLAGGVAAGELHALPGKPVEMRTLVEGRALVAEIAPAEVIGEDKDDVGTTFCGSFAPGVEAEDRQADGQRDKK